MCEHCGCQALDTIAELTAEHNELVTLAGQVQRHLRVGEYAAVQATCAAMLAILGLLPSTLHLLREHIVKEQDGLFPAALAALDSRDWQRAEAVRAQTAPLVPTRG